MGKWVAGGMEPRRWVTWWVHVTFTMERGAECSKWWAGGGWRSRAGVLVRQEARCDQGPTDQPGPPLPFIREEPRYKTPKPSPNHHPSSDPQTAFVHLYSSLVSADLVEPTKRACREAYPDPPHFIKIVQ